MNRLSFRALFSIIALVLWGALLSVHAADQPLAPRFSGDEALVADFLAIRQALIAEEKVDIGEMSKAIRSAIADGEKLEREAKYELALERLKLLEKFAPLAGLPSFDVHMLSSWLYARTGDAKTAAVHRARADAMRETLMHRVGTGRSPDSPVLALMNSDVVEWTRMHLAQIAGVKSYPHQGRELLAVTYVGPTTNNKPAIAYFEIDPRVRARINAKISQFAPIPLDQMRPADKANFETARLKRDAILNDPALRYHELLIAVKVAVKKSEKLDQQGKTEEAIAALKELESVRPIEDIPILDLIVMYSYLNGKVGNRQKQTELRGLIFGINQAIAHSGDALSPETAVHVISIDEEYAWLRDKRLTMRLQNIRDLPLGKFDVMTARNSAGEERDYFFNITRMYAKYDQLLGIPNAK